MTNSNQGKEDFSLEKKKEEKIVPVKIEDKPFKEFINSHLIPQFQDELKNKGIQLDSIILKKGTRPIVGGECWFVYGEFSSGKRFWLIFSTDNIKSLKNIALAESSSQPSLLESFLIDEKKITLQLLTSRFLQRLNGQKWLGSN